jgi:thiol-disulfide isomerase/thioredoxin
MDDTLSISSVPVFKESGEKISENDPILRDDETFNNFWPTLYSDKKGNPKAMVLIKMTEKDKEMMARLSKEMDEINQQMVGKPLPEFEGKTLSGLSVSNESLKGKTVVFNFWFVNCKPCIEEIPRLNELVKKYQNHPDIVFLSVTFDKDKKVKNLLKKQPFL